jgi:hypothetical protein
MTAGPMALAASVEGAIAPTASPKALEVKLSRDKMLRYFNKRPGLGWRPHKG